MVHRILSFAFILFLASVQAQTPKKWTASDIYEGIEKLQFLGSALYIAAHPDDENTTLISYLSNEVKAETAYLSLTRGDGGQNLIGTEIRELLGLIRTNELLQARNVDGGKQFFSRANDFGYSKHPDETLNIWNKDQVLSDVIWVIRQWKPDIIVNRFDHRTPGKTHGHHTTSAMLSVEAFDLANDPTIYPEQLKYVEPWQPRRTFFNTSWWFYGSQDKFAKADKTNMASVDVGVFYPLEGKSNTEISALSRSMHKSQGFGRTGTRGTESDYLELVKGDMPANKENLFDGINTTWSRVEGGAPVGELLATIQQTFDFSNPAASVSNLLLAYKMIQTLPDSHWKQIKSKELAEIIEASLGLYLEAVADDYSATPGEEIELTIEAIQRAGDDVVLKSFSYLPMNTDTVADLVLERNQAYKFFKEITLPKDLTYTNPYWLNEEAKMGMYTVKDQAMRGQPITPRALQVQFNVEIEGVPFSYRKDVVFKRNDPVAGEVYRPFEITPPVATNVNSKVYVFANNQPQNIEVIVKAAKSKVSGKVTLAHPDGWKVVPESIDFELSLKEEEFKTTFELTPPATQTEGYIVPMATVDGEHYTDESVIIEYSHIPVQTVYRDASAKVVKIDLKKSGERIAYIMGAGDEIPTSLEQIGYRVDLLNDGDITLDNLKIYDALIIGIRAYNTNERMKFYQPTLMQYVQEGGTMIVQYNTTSRLAMPSNEIGPYPFKLSRDRVSVEEAEVRMLAPDHPVLNYPNKITKKDFEGWVQERGLYFPNEWDENYTAILSSNDPNEPARDGGLLVAKYGKGYYIYSGYSWFRELPAGVTGAFRLFTNMISIGDYQPEPITEEVKEEKNYPFWMFWKKKEETE